jgi:hypothetical protein
MSSRTTLACAIAAFTFSMPAVADEADGSQHVIKFEGTRTRAEVQAEAALVPRTRSMEPAGSRVSPRVVSKVLPETVRAEAVRAARLGQTTRGEL